MDDDKNSLSGELNLRKRSSISRIKRRSMITDSNQVCYAKMLGCRVQEGREEIEGCE